MVPTIARRLIQTIPSLLGVYTLIFALLRVIPGDPAMQLARDGLLSPETIENLRQQLHLNRPLPEQYIFGLVDILRGDMGRSFSFNRNVSDLILEFLPNSAQLAFSALIIAIVVGMGLGMLAALKPGSLVDRVSMFLAVVGVSMPDFWIGLMLIFTFVLMLGLFPLTGNEGLKLLVLPAVTLAFRPLASISRLTRSCLLEVMGQDFIRTARAKGLHTSRIVSAHALKNAIIPVVTVIGLDLASLISGAVVVETVFARPGLGRLIVSSIYDKDIPVIQGTLVVVAAIYILMNMIVDILYTVLDPRMRES